MYLSLHGSPLPLMGGRFELKAEYTPGDREPGQVRLSLLDLATYDSLETSLRLDPWEYEGYFILEPSAGESLILCGAQRIVTLGMSDLEPIAAVSLEYEEAETIDRPWFIEVGSSLILATERRVWCQDGRTGIRWTWSTRVRPDDAWWIYAEPVVELSSVRVPIRSMHSDDSVVLSLRDAS